MWHCSVDVPYSWLSDWTRLQWALHKLTLIFGLLHSDFLDVGRKIEIHNNGLLGKGKIESFYLSGHKLRQNYRQFSFFHCSIGNFGVNISSYGRHNF